MIEVTCARGVGLFVFGWFACLHMLVLSRAVAPFPML